MITKELKYLFIVPELNEEQFIKLFDAAQNLRYANYVSIQKDRLNTNITITGVESFSANVAEQFYLLALQKFNTTLEVFEKKKIIV